MQKDQLIKDYHRVLKMIQNYSVGDVEKLIASMQTFVELMRGLGCEDEPETELTRAENIVGEDVAELPTEHAQRA